MDFTSPSTTTDSTDSSDDSTDSSDDSIITYIIGGSLLVSGICFSLIMFILFSMNSGGKRYK